MNLFRIKPLNQEVHHASTLSRCLNAFDLTLLGIGAVIGAGVFVLTGIAAATKAGPGITLSYIIAGVASMFAALAYAELAACIGGCGSAYNYAYCGFGECIAWVIGWNLILEYALAVATVAIGWSGYVNDILIAIHIHLPINFMKGPMEGGIINLPAVCIIAILAILLGIGVKHSARFNAVIVFIKLITIFIFCAIATQHLNWHNWDPFLPFGWEGVSQGAALVFFAYVGFDALSTAAEETIHPQRNVPIGILASMLICMVIYIIVAVLLTASTHYTTLNVKSPVAHALLNLGMPIAAGIVGAGAVAGLTTVMLVMFYGLTRICLAISRDGLLPIRFAKTHPRTKTPLMIISISAIIIAAIAGLVPLNDAAELVNIGTLAAFVVVCGGVAILRLTHPEWPRPFKLPFNPLIPLLGVIFCLYLMMHLPAITWWRFGIWTVIGFVIYFAYSIKNSRLGKLAE